MAGNEHPRVIHPDVERAGTLDGHRGRRLARISIAHVKLREEGGRTDLLGRRCRGALVDVGGVHRESARREGTGDLEAEPPTGTGYERCWHGGSIERRRRPGHGRSTAAYPEEAFQE